MSSFSPMATRDLAAVFHPMTQISTLNEQGPMMIVRGEGIHVWDEAGNQYIDGLAGLWCASLGYANEEIAQVAYEQVKTLSYGHLFLDKSHTTAMELAEKLKQMVPGDFSKVFFGLSGSDANDTQIKLVRYYHNAIGRPRKKKIIARQKAYHGITFAAASATGLQPFHQGFDLPVEGFLHTDCPHHYRFAEPGESEAEFATRLAASLEAMILREDPDTVAAFIAEPIMGAGGVLVPPETYFEKVQAVLRKYDILFIADEVITGFGRTGEPFAAQTFDLAPDTMSLAKALTSAYMPLSAVMIPEFMYQAIAEISKEWGIFGHGFTYTGHPVSTAVGLKVLEIYERDDVFAKAARLGEQFQTHIARFADHPLVGEVRGRGLIGACELVANKQNGQAFDPASGVGKYALARMKANGLICRAIGDSLALCPPLITSQDELGELFSRYGRALDETLEWVRREGLLAA
ncbi:MAG: aminotransferase class III-fold pyridoxal phosphate-dependent enzyme [Gammaproteobacteria bacterium]|nr:aminotransferase class III-fold pyridoxal phosphate-dependent enzyme [Gammaproteobacteria bacterium]MCP5198406.1 aminotransferase class III-fold pyridoxal phosphate-dependent enzyme [Gammaproteobacteria bacterium]